MQHLIIFKLLKSLKNGRDGKQEEASFELKKKRPSTVLLLGTTYAAGSVCFFMAWKY